MSTAGIAPQEQQSRTCKHWLKTRVCGLILARHVCAGLGQLQAGVDAAAPVIQVQRVQEDLSTQPTTGPCWQGEAF